MRERSFWIIGVAVLLLAGVANAQASSALAELELSEPYSFGSPFDPQVPRFSFLAVEGATVPVISARPEDPDAELFLDGVPMPAGLETSLADLTPGDSIELEVIAPDGASSTVYELLYLPSDFPLITVLERSASVAPGALYLSPFWYSRTENRLISGYLTIIDNWGVPVRWRRMDYRAVDFKLHRAGFASYYERNSVNENGRNDGQVVLLSRDLKHEIARFRAVGVDHTDSHDFLVLDNGNMILMSYDGVERVVDGEQVFYEDTVVQEVDYSVEPPELVFEWRSWGAIDLSDQLQVNGNFPAEYSHGNSVWIDDDGDWIVSLRFTGQVVKIDRQTGDLVWILGGRSSEFRFEDDPLGGFCGQHAASRLENGNILIYDNGTNCPENVPADRGEFSRAVEYELDETTMVARMVWEYRGSNIYSTSQGSAWRLDNGNTLIGWGRHPGGDSRQVTLSEVDADGEIALEMAVSFDGTLASTYRAYRYEDEFFWTPTIEEVDGFEHREIPLTP